MKIDTLNTMPDYNEQLQFLSELNQYNLQKIDQVIQKNLTTNVALIDEIIHYIISAGGKRLRPLILIYIAFAVLEKLQHSKNNNSENKNKNEHSIYTLATVVEFIHTATLLHDDVVDESNLRRTKPTTNAVFGNAPAVLVGDFLYSRAFEMMVSLNNLEVMKVLSKTTNTIAEGEVLQLINIGNLDINIQTYLEVIYCKTAKLFESSCELAILIQDMNNQDENTINTYRNQAKDYGKHLGCAFQLIDDWLDYAGDKDTMGKEIGDDLRQGKLTMPLIYLLEHGNEQQKEAIRTCINNVISNTVSNEDIQNLINIVINSNALDYTKQQAILESEKAKNALKFLDINNHDNAEQSTYTKALNFICDVSIQRLS
jgi:octaprenyl-diphosphate synthase